MKLYSSAAFLILRPQGLQIRSDKFSFLVNRNPIEPQQWAKISPALSTLPDDENKFLNEARRPPEVKFTPQNLQLLFFLPFTLGFRPLLQIFVGVGAPTFCCEDFLMVYSCETAFGDTFPREVSHAEKRAPNSDWSLKWQLGYRNWNKGRDEKDAAFVVGVPFFSFLPFPAALLNACYAGYFSLAPTRVIPDENKNKRAQSTLVERDPLSAGKKTWNVHICCKTN